MLPSAIATGIMMPISGFVFDKIGAKPLVIPGLFLLGWASYQLSFININTSKEAISLLLVIRGFGLGMALMPINAVGMNAVPQKLVGRASALSNTIRQVMSSLSITIMTMTINARVNNNYARLSEQVTAFNSQAVNMFNQLQGLFTLNRFSAVQARGATTSVVYGLVYKQAYVDAMDYSIAITVIAVGVAIILAFFMRGKKQETSPNGNNQTEGEGLTNAAVFE
jgi:hypothetical protein